MYRHSLQSVLIFGLAALLAACGLGEDEQQQCEVQEDSDEGVTQIFCPDGTSAEVPHGDDGASCTVENNDDGTSTISCEDGTEVVVEDGADGADGDDGTSCTVESTDEGVVVSCEDGSQETVADGTSCSVTDNDDSTATISCEDGTEVVVEDGDSCSVEDHDDGTATVSCEDGTEATVGCTAETNDDGETVTISCGDQEVTFSGGGGGDCTIDHMDGDQYELTCGDDSVVIYDDDPDQHCSVTDNDDGTATVSCPDGTQATFPLSSPDLSVVDFDADLDRHDVVFEATIENNGTDDADGFWVDFFVDASQTPDPEQNYFGDYQHYVDGLDVDQQTTVEATIPAVDDGDYDTWVVADTLAQLPEQDRDDNVAGPETLNIDYEGPDTNLEVTNFDASVTDDHVIEWEATIINNGNETSERFRVDFFYNETNAPSQGDFSYDHVIVDPIEDGDNTNIESAMDPSWYNDGDYDSWIYADTHGHNNDLDVNDNVAGPVDIFVDDGKDTGGDTDFELEEFDAYGGDGVDQAAFVAEFTNIGDEASDFYFLDYYYDADTYPGTTFGDDHDEFGSLDVGETQRIFYTFSQTAGTYTGWGIIFPGDNDDADSTNRDLSDDYTVTTDD